MLVLRRNPNEEIVIEVPASNTPTQLVIRNTGWQWAKIGIEAPRDVQITRPDAKVTVSKERCKNDH
jgi:sRNA-binding carbon storage regulator CsrA